MRVLELVVQGVKGWPAQARIALQPGHCVLRAPATAQLRPVLEALLFYDGRPNPDDAKLEAPGAPAVRAGLTFLGKDGFTYRLVRDLRGGCALHRLDQAAGKFVPFTQDALEIGQYLRTQVGMPPRALFTELFTLGVEKLPTLRDFEAEAEAQNPKPLSKFGLAGADKGKGGHGGHGSNPHGPRPAEVKFRGFQGIEGLPEPGDGGGLSPEQAQQRLELCKTELENARKVEKLQFQLDGLTAKLFALEEKVKVLAQAEGELAGARKQVGQFQALAGLPEDLGARIQAYESAAQRRTDALAKLDAEREVLEERAANANPVPITGDPKFWGGVGGGVALLLAAVFTEWKLLALLDVPAFGVATFFAIRYVSELQSRDGLSRKRDLLDERQKKVDEQYQADTAEIAALMKKLDVERVSELAERVAGRDAVVSKVAALEQKAASLRADPEVGGAVAEQAQLKGEASKLEGEIGSISGGGFMRAAADVEAEIKRLEAQLAGGGAAKPAAVADAPRAAAGPDPSQKLVEKAADLFQLELPELCQAIAPRVGQYLVALADRRYQAVEFAPGGGLVCQAAGRRVSFPELPGRDRDLVWLAVQLTVLERYSARAKLPIVFDDPFSFLDGPHQELAGKMVKYLGSLTQVLHRTTLAPLAGAADAVVEVS